MPPRRWRWIFLSVDSLQRGMGRPALQQRAIHQKVLIAEQCFHLWRTHQLLQAAPHDIVIEKSLPILFEHGGVLEDYPGSGPQTSGTAGYRGPYRPVCGSATANK